MRGLVRQHRRFFLLVSLAGIALRLLFLLRFPSITNDSFVYGDIAKNWLLHGIYGLSGADGVTPTLIRLPGYPAFLALIFSIFGMEHYRAVLLVQVVFDIATCYLIADLARRTAGDRASRAAFTLSAVCPFLANYAAAALAETLEVFLTVLALNIAVIAFERLEQSAPAQSPWSRPALAWAASGLACGCAILFRPDGALLPAVIGIYLLFWWFKKRSSVSAASMIGLAALFSICVLAPLAPWTRRNLRTFHVFQPLAPRYANGDGDFVPMGFNRWVKTWMADYVSVEEIYWNEPGDPIDGAKLPSRAFDTSDERRQTLALLDAYNQTQEISPELDAQFEALAEQRIARSPLRYYLSLPVVRVIDMWLRPRTELLPSDTRWFEFNDDPRWSVLAFIMGAIGLAYVALALAGLARSHGLRWIALLVWFVAARSIFLATLENPEPRYTLECYPIVILLASHLLTMRYTSHNPIYKNP